MARVSRSQTENGGAKGLVLWPRRPKEPLKSLSRTDEALHTGRQQQKHRAKGRSERERLLPHWALTVHDICFT